MCLCFVLYGLWYVYEVLYVRFNYFVVRGYALSRMYINVRNSDRFSVVNMYLGHLKLCIECINKHDEPTP